jgi:hypothetical protein
MTTYTDGLNGASLIDCAGTATSVTTAPVAGGVLYGATGSTVACTAAGTVGQVFTSNGAGIPTWQTTAAAPGAIMNFNSAGNISANTYIAQSRFSANLGDGMFIVPCTGTITTIHVGYINRASGAAVAPGGVTTRTATLWYGSGTTTPTATAFTVTCTGAQSANSGTGSQAVTAGDRIAIRQTVTGAPSPAAMLVSIVIT